MQNRRGRRIRSLGKHLREVACNEILNHNRTGASNGPTDELNRLVKFQIVPVLGSTCFERFYHCPCSSALAS